MERCEKATNENNKSLHLERTHTGKRTGEPEGLRSLVDSLLLSILNVPKSSSSEEVSASLASIVALTLQTNYFPLKNSNIAKGQSF